MLMSQKDSHVKDPDNVWVILCAVATSPLSFRVLVVCFSPDFTDAARVHVFSSTAGEWKKLGLQRGV